MKPGPASRRILGAALAAGLALVLGYGFRAYQDPAHIAQWLALLQLCR